jgi:hypothetical protein
LELEDEQEWLRYRVIRMRMALRFAMSPEVATVLRELIADAEQRLAALEIIERARGAKVLNLFPTPRTHFRDPKTKK